MIKKQLKFYKQNEIKIELDVLKEAIIDYRNDGKELMRKLAKKYGLNIEDEKDYEKLTARNNEETPRKGELSKHWNMLSTVVNVGFIIKSINNKSKLY